MNGFAYNAYCWLCHHSSTVGFTVPPPNANSILQPGDLPTQIQRQKGVEGVMEKDKVIDTENSSFQSSDMLSELLAWLTSVGHSPFDILLQLFDFLPLRTLDPPILPSLLFPQLTSSESQPLPGFKVLGAVTIAMALPWLTSVSQALSATKICVKPKPSHTS